jgi:hypothetical protein
MLFQIQPVSALIGMIRVFIKDAKLTEIARGGSVSYRSGERRTNGGNETQSQAPGPPHADWATGGGMMLFKRLLAMMLSFP